MAPWVRLHYAHSDFPAMGIVGASAYRICHHLKLANRASCHGDGLAACRPEEPAIRLLLSTEGDQSVPEPTSLVAFALIALGFRANQVATGLAIGILGQGLSALFGKSYESMTVKGLPKIGIPGLSDLPVVGGLFVLAGVSGRAAESKGLGGALTWLVKQPFVPWLLGAVALGIGCYGIYSFFRARHTKV